MLDKNYRLRYLPLFYDDLEEKVRYIAENLQNLKAANDLLDKVEAAILERLPIAESFENIAFPAVSTGIYVIPKRKRQRWR